MTPRAIAFILCSVLVAAPMARAQEVYTYIAHWRVPRASFQSAAKANDESIAGLEKLVADGTILHWGIDEPFVHSTAGHTHGSWFAATSLEGIDAAMSSQTGDNPIAGAAEGHHDHLFRSLAHGGRTSNIRNGYLRSINVRVKTGMNQQWLQHARAAYGPVFDALVEDGTVLVWEISTEAIHVAGNPRRRIIWYVTPDAAGVDKVTAALAEDREKRPGPYTAMQAAAEIDGHTDGLARVDFQHK